jgi:polyhydroxybutyrate depolymerase
MPCPLRIMILSLVLFSACVVLPSASPRGKSIYHELKVNGATRSYRVYCPENICPKNLPLMLVLHGGLGNAREIEKSTGMSEIADNGGFLVVYPNGTEGRFGLKDRRTWNAGLCCGMAAKRDSDDIGFIKALIEEIERAYAIDRRRVYVVGMSNGGMMAYRLASEIPNEFAAMVAVSGALTVDDFEAARNIAVLHIHGTDDAFVPVAGGVGTKSVSRTSYQPLADTIERIKMSRKCTTSEVKTVTEGVHSETYHCGHGAPVEIVLIQGGKHAWPGGYGRHAKSDPDRDFSASRYAWEFVRKFSQK